MFARVGGGIYTKAADVGADLVGKVEAGIPEDDPRNPAVIADNVGDNVGDCAGMAADLFETYAVTAVAAMLLAYLFWPGHAGAGRHHLPARARRRVDHRQHHRHLLRAPRQERDPNIMNALYKGLSVSAVIAIVAVLPDHATGCSGSPVEPSLGRRAVASARLFLCAVTGIVVTALIVVITEYYTATRYNPVKSIAKASITGHATNIIQGLAVSMQSTALPVLVIAAGILASYTGRGRRRHGGLYGIAVAVMAMLSMTGIIVAIDAYGPITDNAGGIAEMANMPESVRSTTDPLDAVGNTTKAITKGYAIGSAGFAALILFVSYTLDLQEHFLQQYNFHGTIKFMIDNPWVLAGLFIGGMLPYLFASLCMTAVGKAGGQVVEEVRRQFREMPGIMDGTRSRTTPRPSTSSPSRPSSKMLLPAAIPVLTPIIIGLAFRQHGFEVLGGVLMGCIITGIFLAICMTSRRRRLGQRQEAHRGRRVRRQGLRRPRGRRHRRHRRRPLQGHRRPRHQPDDQGHQHRGPARHPVPHQVTGTHSRAARAALSETPAGGLRAARRRSSGLRAPLAKDGASLIALSYAPFPALMRS